MLTKKHGLALAFAATLGWMGCGSGGDEYKPIDTNKPVVKEAHDHGHGHGPNGGHLIELGNEEYHAEVVFDPASRKSTIYILGSDAKTAHPIAVESAGLILHLHSGKDEVELTMTAVPLEGEADGMSSRFEAAGDTLPEAIKTEEDFEGHIHITIGGKEYSGDIEHDHGHAHDHAHDHGDAAKKPAEPEAKPEGT